MAKQAVMEIRGMNKHFGPTVALKDVDLDFYPGEIRGLVGENGSGKSTVTSIMAGMQKATSGEMKYNGEPWKPLSMAWAQEKGVCMILQEANTVAGCTVAENIFAGRLSEFGKFGVINMKKLNAAAQELLDSFGLGRIKASDQIANYTFEDRKLVEIVRCVTEDTVILVVDETTTALSLDGRQILYKLMHSLADRGRTVVFISHDMDEILEQCTTLTVLRDGNIIGTLDEEELAQAKDEEKREKLVEKIRFMMVGRDIGNAYYREDYDTSHLEEVALEFKDVSVGPIKHFSLQLHKGEILGFGGLSDCGMRLIGRAGLGLERFEGGQVVRGGKVIDSPLKAIRSGIGYISKNRDTEALILSAPIGYNIALPSYDELSRFSFIDPVKENKTVTNEAGKYAVKCKTVRQNVSTLSGGNKQKVSFAKWTAKDSDVLIMDCPTRGVDIGVKQSMYALIAQMKRDGKAIILISEELSELSGMADKIMIMKDGEVTGEFMRSPDLQETDIIGSMI